jgi:hypothetical protein
LNAGKADKDNYKAKMNRQKGAVSTDPKKGAKTGKNAGGKKARK